MKFFAIASCMLAAICMSDGASAQNTDRVRSSERINGDAAFAVRTKSSTPQVSARCGAFDAGWGPCSKYAPGGSNYGYCADKDECLGLFAFEACDECPAFNAGYGTCETYAPGQPNHWRCGYNDYDSCLGLHASEACEECASCPAFNAGYGTCETYAPGGSNYDYCDSDKDECLGLHASEACDECSASCPAFDAGFGTCDTYAPGQPNNGRCGYNDYDSCLGKYADEECYECWDYCFAFDTYVTDLYASDEGTNCVVEIEVWHLDGDWELLGSDYLYGIAGGQQYDEHCWKGYGSKSVDSIDIWIDCDDKFLLIDRAWLVNTWGQTVQSWGADGGDPNSPNGGDYYCLSTNPLDISHCNEGLAFHIDGSVEFDPV